MAISTRTVKNKRDSNGKMTGKPGTVYDVRIKYKQGGIYKEHTKKGFITKQLAIKYEAEMRAKLGNPAYAPPTYAQSQMTVDEYLGEWVERHGAINLRPSTLASYKGHIKNQILPYIGDVPLSQLTPAMLDDMYRKHLEDGLSPSTSKYAHRILSTALEHARKYHYVETNVAKDIITKFGKNGKTPDPYNIEEMRNLLGVAIGTEWEMMVVLGGLYGLRLSEILGLRWKNVDFENNLFHVVEQLPYDLPADNTLVHDMAPVKSEVRTLPITEKTQIYFERQLEMQNFKKKMHSSMEYFENDLVVSKPDGSPLRRKALSAAWPHFIEHAGMRHNRFHDLRHAAATNIYQLSGDFYCVGQILGHSLKGVGLQLNISSNFDAVTATYIDVRVERKREVLDIYHNTLHNQME